MYGNGIGYDTYSIKRIGCITTTNVNKKVTIKVGNAYQLKD